MKLTFKFVVDRDSTRRPCANRHESEPMRTLHLLSVTAGQPAMPLTLELPASQLADVELGDTLTVTVSNERIIGEKE